MWKWSPAGANAHPHAGDRQADAEHHRHPPPAAPPARPSERSADQHGRLGRQRRPARWRWSPRCTARAPTAAIAARGQADRAAHGGGSGPRPECQGMGISGIGGISTWRDAAEFLTSGHGVALPPCITASRSWKTCRRSVNWMDEKGYRPSTRGAVGNYVEWGDLANYEIIAGSTRRPASSAVATSPGGHRTGDRRDRVGPPPLRGDRCRMRRLQSLHACLPGGQLHHHGG